MLNHTKTEKALRKLLKDKGVKYSASADETALLRLVLDAKAIKYEFGENRDSLLAKLIATVSV